jgi:hypothetical protein
MEIVYPGTYGRRTNDRHKSIENYLTQKFNHCAETNKKWLRKYKALKYKLTEDEDASLWSYPEDEADSSDGIKRRRMLYEWRFARPKRRSDYKSANNFLKNTFKSLYNPYEPFPTHRRKLWEVLKILFG